MSEETPREPLSGHSGDKEMDPKKKPDVRVYLEEKVFPILTNGLEELLKAVEDREKKLKEVGEEEDIPEIQPLYFLARYLMRNAPKNSDKNTARSGSSTSSVHKTETEDKQSESEKDEASGQTEEDDNDDN